MIRLATFNVHEWTNGLHKYSLQSIVKLIISSNIDILALQETTETQLQKIKALNIYNYIHYKDCAILSKFPIKKHKPSKHVERFINADIVLPNNLPVLNITCLHLDYETEPTRIKELQNIMNYIDDKTKIYPSIVLGDFNSLTQKDYNKKEWQDISDIRKINMWEKPVSDITNMMTQKYNYYDTRNIAIQKTGDLYTCRFHTRIDYIYCNHLLHNKFHIKKCEHINAIPDISDHNLIVTSIIYNNNQSNNETKK